MALRSVLCRPNFVTGKTFLMYVIGLTGGIGSGKSTVAEVLRQKGAVVLGADEIGHQVYLPGTPAWQEIVEAFGHEVLAPDGTIDRRRLGALVFSDPQALERLNAITHPRMKEMMRQRLSELERQGVQVAVLEAALLLEAGWDDLADEVWATVAPPEVAARRTAERMGVSVEEALARLKAQMDNQERIRRADVVIDTDCSLEETRRRAEEAWERVERRIGSPSG